MKTRLVCLSTLVVCVTCIAQSPQTSAFSKSPLTQDEIAIYRTFLSSYSTGVDAPINLSNTTSEFVPLDMDIRGCLKDFPTPMTITEVHHFGNEFSELRNIRLIDTNTHAIADPGEAIKKGGSVEHSVQEGFEAGVLTISEIHFDQQHHLAAFQYFFRCGSLCGNGATVVFELRDNKWIKSKHFCSISMS